MRNYLPFWFITVEKNFSSNVFSMDKNDKSMELDQIKQFWKSVKKSCLLRQLYNIFYTSSSTKQLKLMQLTFGNGLENFTPCLAWELC